MDISETFANDYILAKVFKSTMGSFFKVALYATLVVCANGLPQLFDFFRSGTVNNNSSGYGVDVSFPIHHGINSHLHPHFAHRYQAFMQGCYNAYSRSACDSTERSRLQMNLQQPASQHNYTEAGFLKTQVPPTVWSAILAFYEQNKETEKREDWPAGNTYVNHWQTPSYMISLEDRRLRAGLQLKNTIWSGIQPIIENWVGYPVEPTSLYGIRVYKRGAILATHVDRLPLVSSAIIQVAQDMDIDEKDETAGNNANNSVEIADKRTKDWFLEVYDHAGRAHNVSMRPGDLVLYESHTVLHGRPFPLEGNFYANIFVHFKPKEHDRLNEEDKRKVQEEYLSNTEIDKKYDDQNKQQKKDETPLDPFRRRFTHIN